MEGNGTYGAAGAGAAMDVDDDENDKCEVCARGDRERQLLLCDACNEGAYSLVPRPVVGDDA